MAYKSKTTGDKKVQKAPKTKKIEVTSTRLVYNGCVFERGQQLNVNEKDYSKLASTGAIKVVK